MCVFGPSSEDCGLGRVKAWIIAAALFVVLFVFLSVIFPADSRGAGIPPEAGRYRSEMIRNVQYVWGLQAPVAVFAAQIHQESRWDSEALSPVGASGLGQFMPTTAKDMARRHPDLGPARPWNPGWALRALATYDLDLWRQAESLSPVDGCERWAMTLSGYNGGFGWVLRDVRMARAKGLDSSRWFGGVELANAGRSPQAFAENRGYPRVILLKHAPLYVRAGWGKGGCP